MDNSEPLSIDDSWSAALIILKEIVNWEWDDKIVYLLFLISFPEHGLSLNGTI